MTTTATTEAPAARPPAALPLRAAEPERRLPAHSVRRRRLIAAAVGVGATVLVAAGSWIPSVWYDEAATIVSARRSLAALAVEVQHVDAVHALYYLLMHGWLSLVGYSPLTLRLPSAIAVGLTAALLVEIVGSRRGLSAGLLSGVVFALIPRVGWMGGEGRSYAMSALAALIVTVLLLRALERSTRGRWIAYGAGILAGALLFVFVLLVVAGHLLVLLLRAARRRRAGPLLRWLAAAGTAGVLILPFFVLLITQGGQVSWVHEIGRHSIKAVLVTQWFGGSTAVAVVAWPLLAVGIARLLRPGLLRSGRRRDAGPRPEPAPLPGLLIAGALVPTAGLIAATAVYLPLYSPRYVALSTPFVAALIAAALARPLPRPAAALAVVAIAALSAPLLVAARAPAAKQQSTWEQVGAVVAQERRAHPEGVAIVFGPVRYHVSATTRVIEYAYPDDFAGTLDVTLQETPAEHGRLWESRGRLADGLSRIEAARPGVVLLVTSIKRDRREATAAELATIGWQERSERRLGDVRIVEYAPDPAGQG